MYKTRTSQGGTWVVLYQKVMVGGAWGRWVSESSESKLEEIRDRTPLCLLSVPPIILVSSYRYSLPYKNITFTDSHIRGWNFWNPLQRF